MKTAKFSNFILNKSEIDDTAKEDIARFKDSLHAKRFQKLKTSLLESIWVSNLKGELSKDRRSSLVNFSVPRNQLTKFRAQKIRVECSNAN